ncbi:MAG TPA: hypothetical protein PK788_07670 [Gemmatimonadaceae bacterium]|nr:hypothetical protein [Gemmatimonadaceae bacterium]
MASRPPEKKTSNIGRPTKNADGSLQKPRTERKGAFKRPRKPKKGTDEATTTPEGKRPPGRPAVLPTISPEVIGSMLTLLRDGNYLETAAAYLGVHKDTLHDWLKRGAKDRSSGNLETPYAEFHLAVEKALAEAEIRDNRVISQASSRNWTAAAWRLERRNPKRWARKDSLDVGLGQSKERGPVETRFTLRVEDRTAAKGAVNEKEGAK